MIRTFIRLYQYRRAIGMSRRNALAYAWQAMRRGYQWTLLP